MPGSIPDRTVQGVVRACYSAGENLGAVRGQLLQTLRRVVPFDAAFMAIADPDSLLFTSAFTDDALIASTPLFLDNEFSASTDVNRFVDLARARDPVASLDDATGGERTPRRAPRSGRVEGENRGATKIDGGGRPLQLVRPERNRPRRHAGRQPTAKGGEERNGHVSPSDVGELEEREVLAETLCVGAESVRRAAVETQELEELLGLGDREIVGAEDGPRSLLARGVHRRDERHGCSMTIAAVAMVDPRSPTAVNRCGFVRWREVVGAE